MSPVDFTLGAALRWAAERLRAVTDRPHLEAEVLLASLLVRGREFLFAHPDLELTASQRSNYIAWVERRAINEPLPYITGQAKFCGLEFTITPDVLIPRPETELLVEEARAWMQHRAVHCIMDVGTGSGCLAVTLALRAPDMRIYATDISPAALHVAKDNAVRHGVAERITFWEGDLWPASWAEIDVIVSNPPYIAEEEWESLPLSVQQEPRVALWGGRAGLSVIQPLLQKSRDCLRAGGLLLVEIGERQGDAVLAMARSCFPQAQVHVLRDLGGKERVLSLHKVSD